MEDKSMSIGSTIKRLRRENNITQERLAEYLGITSRAISQWECDRTTPDISQIPALCHIFDVSSDVILGIDIEKNNQVIQYYIDKAREEEEYGNWGSSIEILREAIRKFPKSYQLMNLLANALVCVYSHNNIKEYDEVFHLCNLILSECTDSVTRYEAVATLVRAYEYAGKKDELLCLAKEMPRSRYSYENFMKYYWSGDTDFKEIQNYMSYLIYHTIELIGLVALQQHNDNEFIYSIEDRRNLWKLTVALLELLFPDGDYQGFAQFGISAYEHLCSSYGYVKDYANTLYWLEKAIDFAIHMDTSDFVAPHTSPILRGYSSNGCIVDEKSNYSQTMLNWLADNRETIGLYSDPRYCILVERLKKVATNI